MAYVPNFANDIFISYSHIDNRAEWVSEFHTRLKDRLLELDVDCNVWRDLKLNGADEFSKVIFENLEKSALLITVISPQGMKSHWCEEERQKFTQYAELTGGFQFGNTIRAIKVVKTPLDGDAHRGLFGTLGFDFYQRNSETGRFREFTGDEFTAKLDELAQEIKRVLIELRAGYLAKDKPGIYIAETTSDLNPDREALVRQVREWGYEVYPRADLPHEASAFRTLVTAELGRSLLSIHLFSDKRGTIMDDEKISFVAVQYELAKQRDLDRIAWVRPGITLNDDLATVLAMDKGDALERLEGRTFEDLKDEIESRLKRLQGQRKVVDKTARRNVYLICGQADLKEILKAAERNVPLPLISFLEEKGFSVWLPPETITDENERLDDLRETLEISDAAILYWSNSDEKSFRRNFREVIKARTLRNGQRTLTVGAYIGPPPLGIKKVFRNNFDLFMEQVGDFQPELVEPLISRINAGKPSTC